MTRHEQIYRFVTANPGCSGVEVSRALGFVAQAPIKSMVKRGFLAVVWERRAGRRWSLFVTPKPFVPRPVIARRPLAADRLDALERVVTTLETIVAEQQTEIERLAAMLPGPGDVGAGGHGH